MVAQAGLYALATGAQVSLSPLLLFPQLATDSGDLSVWTWKFDGALTLRCGGASWYALSLPYLALLTQGIWPAAITSVTEPWLVDSDGSSVALNYNNDGRGPLHGFPPADSTAKSLSQRLGEARRHRHVRDE